MKKSQSLILFSIVLTLFTLSTTLTVFAEQTNTTPLEVNPNLITRGTPAADFTLEDVISDTVFTFSSFGGKVIILDFFSTSCIPCVHSIPNLRNAKAKYSADDLEIISVDVDLDDSESEIETFAAGFEMDWKIVRDTVNINQYYQLLEIPTFYIIDQDFLIYQAVFGSEDAFNYLDSFLLELLPDYSNSPNPTNNPGGGSISEFWANNWYWFVLGGVMFVVVIGLIVQRRRIVVHNKKVRAQKTEARQRRIRKKER